MTGSREIEKGRKQFSLLSGLGDCCAVLSWLSEMFNPIINLSLSSAQLQAVQNGNFFREYVVLELLHIFCVFFSLSLNIIMLIVFARKRKKIFEASTKFIFNIENLIQSTFYSVVAVLTLFTLLKALVQAIFVVPQYAVTGAIFTESSRKCFFFLDTFADYGILIFSAVMAANRFCTFNMASKCPIFSRIRFLLPANFMGVLLIAIVSSSIGCSKQYSPSANAYVDVCPLSSTATTIQHLLIALYYVVCAISLTFYMGTYWLIRSQRGYLINNERQRCGPETVILKQAVVIFGLYILYIGVSSSLPLHSSDGLSFRLTYLLNIISILIAAVFPGLLLSSSREMRSEICSWLVICGMKNEWATYAMRAASGSALNTHRRTPSISISPAESRV